MTSMLRFDQLQLLLDVCTPGPDREIELQVTGLSREDFTALFRCLHASDHLQKLPVQNTKDVFLTGSQRGTYFPEDEKKEPVLIQKTLEHRKRVLHPNSGFEFVLTAKRERVLHVPPEAWSEPQFVRTKKRYSFLSPNMRYDLTVVFPESPTEGRLPERCELELEMLPDAEKMPLQVAETLVGRALQLVRQVRPDATGQEIVVLEEN